MLAKNKDLNPAAGLFDSSGENDSANENPRNTSSGSDETAFKFTMPKAAKKRRKKVTSFNLYEDDAAEFLAIAKKLGYSGSDIINQFISDFIKANKRQ